MYTKFILEIGIYLYPVGSIHLSPTYFLFGLRGLTGNSVNGSSKRSLLRKLANRSRKSFLKNSHCHSNKISKPERPKKVVVVTVKPDALNFEFISVPKNNLEYSFIRCKTNCACAASWSSQLVWWAASLIIELTEESYTNYHHFTRRQLATISTEISEVRKCSRTLEERVLLQDGEVISDSVGNRRKHRYGYKTV
jgi:hypothetical protein